MAGFSNNATFWNVGEGTGRNGASGGTALSPTASVAISVSAVAVIGSGSATPTAAPSGAPFYIDTDTDDLLAWNGTAWVGPYSTAT